MRHPRPSLLLLPLLFAPAVLAAQKADVPAAEAQRLAAYAGKWAIEGNVAGIDGTPGGRLRGSETCELMSGGFQVVCRTEVAGPDGVSKGAGIIAWDSGRRRYVFQGFDSRGRWDDGLGEYKDGKFYWTGESIVGTQAVQSRYTVTEPKADSYTYTWEISTDRGKTWRTFASGTETRSP